MIVEEQTIANDADDQIIDDNGEEDVTNHPDDGFPFSERIGDAERWG